jgi:hypothetical protein
MTFRVLPYHKLGIQKWNDIGIKYRLDSIQEPTPMKYIRFYLKLEPIYTKDSLDLIEIRLGLFCWSKMGL